MPTDRDVEKIEKMVDEIGEVEKKLGVIDESYFKTGDVKKKEVSEDLNELLEDIEVGLREEKELETRVSLKEEDLEETSFESGTEIGKEKIEPEDRVSFEKGLSEIQEPVEGIESEELGIEDIEIPEIEDVERKEEKKVEKKNKEIIQEVETEEILSEDFKEEKNVESPKRSISEPEEKEIELEKEDVSEKELQEEISRLEGMEEIEGEGEGEGLLDLPEDFDIDKLSIKEEPPVGFFKSEKKKEEKREEEKKVTKIETPEEELAKELEGIIEGVESKDKSEQISETIEPAKEELEEIELPEKEFGEFIEEELTGEEAEEEKKEEILEKELTSFETSEPVEKTEEEKEKLEESGIEEIEEGEGVLEEELPEIEEIISEEESFVEPEESISEPEAKATTEAEIEHEPKAVPGLELSDEDIILITTKLKQLTPRLALAIRDSILNSEIPIDNLKGLLDLLIIDAPEEKIKNYYEKITGKEVVIERIPEVIRVEKKPGPLVTVYENLAPLVRITALGLIVVALLLSIFMLFFYRPIKANKYYKAGIVSLQSENFQLAEQDFNKGQSIYPRVIEYDIYGWNYMLTGNYDRAMQKFKEGIRKDEQYKVISLRLHLAKLYNILGNYKEADNLYTEIINRYPKKYEYIKLKGLNLIDWGKIDKEQLKKAYVLYSEANKNFPRESDPVIRMLYINILFDKLENVKNLYDYLNQNFPGKLDEFVHTRLASYFVKKGEFTLAKNLLMKLLARFPEYPPLYYAYAKYYKGIESKKDEELMLNLAIAKEETRKIIYPWDSRNRTLLSNAYNDLGEIYANLEIPGKSAEAIRYFKKAIEENPDNKIAYFNIAQVYFYKEMDYELAEKYYTEAKRKGFVNKDLMYNLGLLYFYKRDFSKAVNSWISLNEVMPGNPNVSFALACAFLHMKKYDAALGELINLSETYNSLIKELGEIKPWKAYHKMILLNAAAVYNNLGVAYEKLYEKTKNLDYQKKSLISLYKAGEFADIIGIDRGNIQYNINYILHPNIIRAGMAISDNISTNYRFVQQ